MYAGIRGNDPTVEVVHGQTCLRAGTGRGRYGTLEIRGTRQWLHLEHVGFVIAVYETLPYWRDVAKFPAAYRPLTEIMQSVNFAPLALENADQWVPFRLDEYCSILMNHSAHQVVSIPLHDFVVQAVTYLAEHPRLRIDGFDFTPKFESSWRCVQGSPTEVPRRIAGQQIEGATIEPHD